MKQHGSATLTVAKRKQVKLLFENEGLSITQLSHKFEVHRDTIRKWIKRDSPFDKSPPKREKRVVTPEYQQAVIEYRKENPRHGAKTIASALQTKFPFANRGTIALILQENGLTRITNPRPKTKWRIPVGKHRLQGDIQQLTAIQGKHGFEYKISFIHLATRWKYSEIHPDCQTETIAEVYQRALDNLPPFS